MIKELEMKPLDDELHISIKIVDVGVKALIDSGSGLNLISKELFKKLTFKYPEIIAKKELKLATDVDGEIIQ